MVKIIVTITAFIISFIASAQVSETRQVNNFSKLSVSQSIEVLYTISDKISVTVETDDAEKMKVIKTEVVGETLKLFIDAENYASKDKKRKNKYNDVPFKILKITISGPNLNEIKASSSAYVKMQNVNKSKNISLSVSSSGTIKGNFESDNTTIDASSSGTLSCDIFTEDLSVETTSSASVKVEGKATNLIAKVSSSGYCNLRELKSENVNVTASSSGSVSVYASKSIDAKATSSGSIRYAGNPSNVSKEKNSSGSISQQ